MIRLAEPLRTPLACLAAGFCLLVGSPAARDVADGLPTVPDASPCRVDTRTTAREAQAVATNTSLAMAGEDRPSRLRAVSALAELGGERAAAALAAAASGDRDAAVRAEAIHAVGVLGCEGALEVLDRALLDPDLDVRRAAVEALADLGGEGAARVLAFALGDRDASLREQAVHALGEIGGQAAIGVLQQALADERRSVREAAGEVLAELSSRER